MVCTFVNCGFTVSKRHPRMALKRHQDKVHFTHGCYNPSNDAVYKEQVEDGRCKLCGWQKNETLTVELHVASKHAGELGASPIRCLFCRHETWHTYNLKRHVRVRIVIVNPSKVCTYLVYYYVLCTYA